MEHIAASIPLLQSILGNHVNNTLTIRMKEYINRIGLWHSIAHDKDIDENFVADLKLKIDKKNKNFDK